MKDVKVDSDLEELSMKKLKSKPETTVNLDDTLPMNLEDTVEMSPEEIIAMYGGTEEAIEEEPEAEEIIEPEEEEIIEEEPESRGDYRTGRGRNYRGRVGSRGDY